ncbi:hypothetical protein EVAR_89111_1 [Eumeta japonica]|uniref:Uncharacterized protein n=1 Tax=Eumeta variegata TaxID=151549 RepID=A0A4C1XCX4_EUMVA|nr:hypothetical protein EVAR_89111_1 [Eumeta japonica]
MRTIGVKSGTATEPGQRAGTRLASTETSFNIQDEGTGSMSETAGDKLKKHGIEVGDGYRNRGVAEGKPSQDTSLAAFSNAVSASFDDENCFASSQYFILAVGKRKLNDAKSVLNGERTVTGMLYNKSLVFSDELRRSIVVVKHWDPESRHAVSYGWEL